MAIIDALAALDNDGKLALINFMTRLPALLKAWREQSEFVITKEDWIALDGLAPILGLDLKNVHDPNFDFTEAMQMKFHQFHTLLDLPEPNKDFDEIINE